MDNNSESNIVLIDSERTSCEIWTRVMGYHRPTSGFNIGKKAEFAQRKYFAECKNELALAAAE